MSAWRSVIDPPLLDQEEFGWPTSGPVLAFYKDRGMGVVTYEWQDPSDPNYPREWYSCDSERWLVTDYLTHWMPLPPPPFDDLEA